MDKRIVICTIVGVFLDQISKLLITFFMNLNESIVLIPNFFRLTYVHNEGAAFSMLNGFRWIFVIISIIALYLVYNYFIKDKKTEKCEIIIYSMLISGIIGNMLDRIFYGYVIDFLDFKIFGYNFAIFNLADSFIVISVLILIIMSLGGDKCRNILSE